jgi:hypothetical protein
VQALPERDPGAVDRASQEYLRKYRPSPYAQAMVKPEVLPMTLRLEPRRPPRLPEEPTSIARCRSQVAYLPNTARPALTKPILCNPLGLSPNTPVCGQVGALHSNAVTRVLTAEGWRNHETSKIAST